ncbi:hypothetical protein DFJ77DRAFT_512280 [Powellomyces hirtus]|nr:hypothetical protein DFJ77DRAFT_515709 [Powellomyces hirtus]KAI8911269.1 hypothetical protein DFJ77DRAFT_512280 [Powellomyces hirtus]
MSYLSHVRVALQVHGQGDYLQRLDNHHVSFLPISQNGRQSEPRKLYFDHCFDVTASASDVFAGVRIEALAKSAVKGYSAGLFVAGSGRKFAQNRSSVFVELVTFLESLVKGKGWDVSYAHVALTDTKCLDLVRDKPIDLAANRGSIRNFYQPVLSYAELAEKIRQGCSLPYLLSIRIESSAPGNHTVGHLLMADLGLPCFDESMSEEKLQKRGPGLSLSIRVLRKIVTMLTTAGTEGSVPYDKSHLTTLCESFFGGKGNSTFVLHVDAAGDASQEELAGFVEFAEPLRKLRIIEQANDVDPRLTEAEQLNAKWAKAHRDVVAELEQTRLDMRARQTESESRLAKAEKHFRQEMAALAAEHARSSGKQESTLRTELRKMKEEYEHSLETLRSERDKIITNLKTDHQSHIEEITQKLKAQLARIEEERKERQALYHKELTKALNEKAEADECARQLRVEALHWAHDQHMLTMRCDHLEILLTAAEGRREKLQTLLDGRNAALESTRSELDVLQERHKSEVAEKVTAQESAAELNNKLEEALAETLSLQSQLVSARNVISEQKQQIERINGEMTESIASLETKLQMIAVCEAKLDEARRTHETIRSERDSAIRQTQELRLTSSKEAGTLQRELSEARSAAQHAETEATRLRADATALQKFHREEIADLQQQLNKLRTTAEQRAREWERNEGRFEGEREGWNRQQVAWDRERDRLIEDMQDLKLEIAKARVAGAGEEDKTKAWFAKIEAENRALRDEVAEVKALRRQRRDSDFASVRIQTRADRLEAENARLAEEATRKEAEWHREKERMRIEAEIRERELKAAAARTARKARAEAVEAEAEDVRTEFANPTAGKGPRSRKKAAAEVPPEVPANADELNEEEGMEVEDVAAPPPAAEPKKKPAKKAKNTLPVEPSSPAAPASPAPAAEPAQRKRRKAGPTVDTAADDAEVEQEQPPVVAAEPYHEEQTKPTAGKRTRSRKTAAEVPPKVPANVNELDEEEQMGVKDVPAPSPAAEPKKKPAKKAKNTLPVEPSSPAAPASPAPAVKPAQRKRKKAGATSAVDTAADDAEVEQQQPPIVAEPYHEEQTKPTAVTKKRKLNPGRKVSLDPVEANDENTTTAKRNKSRRAKQGSTDADKNPTPAAAPSSSPPPPTTSTTSAKPSVLSLSQRAESLSSTSSSSHSSSSSTTAANKSFRSQLPNVNTASGRMEFKKRPGLDPERMKAILKGYGFGQ